MPVVGEIDANPADTDTVWWTRIAERLGREYGLPRLRNRRDPLDELIFIILSAQTEEYNYLRTYRALRRRYRSWDAVLVAGESKVFESIRRGGLGRKKARQICLLLAALRDLYGRLSLDFLASMTNEAAEEALLSLPGVGRKTAKCVLMYALDREVLPVDTHVWRLCARLLGADGISPKPSDKVKVALEAAVPSQHRYGVHVGLVLHGRSVCHAINPACQGCFLRDLCRSNGTRPIQVTTASTSRASDSGWPAAPSPANSASVRSHSQGASPAP